MHQEVVFLFVFLSSFFILKEKDADKEIWLEYADKGIRQRVCWILDLHSFWKFQCIASYTAMMLLSAMSESHLYSLTCDPKNSNLYHFTYYGDHWINNVDMFTQDNKIQRNYKTPKTSKQQQSPSNEKTKKSY